MVVTNHTLSYDYKVRKNIITLYCDCGFVYSRKENDDIYKLGRVKRFGALWESKLKKLVTEETYSLRQIAKVLGCDPKTVVSYAEKFNLKHLLNSSMKVFSNKDKKKSKNKVDANEYKGVILDAIRDNPSIIRQEIRKKLNKQYIWLYKNDREWFDKNMPKKKKTNGNNNNMNICWEDRDNKILKLLKNEYNMLMQLNENKRITKSLLGRRINMLALMEKKLDKLPKTKKFLDEVLETVEDFQIRRIDNVCSVMKEQGQELLKWKIIRKAGLRKNYAERLNKQIEFNISKYNNK